MTAFSFERVGALTIVLSHVAPNMDHARAVLNGVAVNGRTTASASREQLERSR